VSDVTHLLRQARSFPTNSAATIVRVGNREHDNLVERTDMAKKKVNKTQMIKQALSDTPEASPKEIAAALKKHGVTAGYVSSIKTQMNTKPKERRQPKGSTSKSVGRPATTTDSLDAAIKFIEQSGGLGAAKAAIEKIERIKNL
jgi:hypothetical protein